MKECPACKKPIETQTACCEYCGLVFAKWEAKNKPVDEKEVEKEIEAARHEFRKEQDKKHYRIIGISIACALVAAGIWFFARPALPGFERQFAEEFIQAIKHSDLDKIRRLANENGLKSVERYGPLSAETLRLINEQIPETYDLVRVANTGKSRVVGIKGKGTAEGSLGKIYFSHEDVLLKVSGQEWDKMEGGFVVLPAYSKDRKLSGILEKQNAEKLNILPVADHLLKETEHFNKKLVKPFYKKDGRLQAITVLADVKNAKLAFSAEGKYLLAASTADNKVKIWRTAEWALIKELELEFRAESAAAVPDSSAFIVGDNSEHGVIIPLNEEGAGSALRFTADLCGALKVAVSGNSRIIATGSMQKALSFWEYPDRIKIMKFEMPFEITGIAFSRTAPYLAASTSNNIFVLWDLRSGKGSPFFAEGIDSGISTTALAISPNGRYILTGYRDGGIAVTDMENYKNKYVVFSGNSAVTAARFSADGKVFATAKDNGKIYIWDIDTGRKLDTLKLHSGSVLAVAFFTRGKLPGFGRRR